MIVPDIFLNTIYNTTKGANYLRFLAPFCLFQYIQAPLSSSLDAMGKSKDVMASATLGMITRTVLLFICSLLKIGLYGLIIAIGVNVIVVTFYSLKKVRKALT